MHPRLRAAAALLFVFSGIAIGLPASAQNVQGDVSGQAIDHKTVTGANVRDASIVASSVLDSTLTGAWVRDATIERSTLDRVAVNNATIRDSTAQRALFEGDTIEGGTYSTVLLQRVLMRGGSLRESTADNATLDGVTLDRVHLCNVRIANENDRVVTSGCPGGATAGGTLPPAPPPTTAPFPPPQPPTTAPVPPPTAPPPPPPPTGQTEIFTNDLQTLARFEFNGDVRDLSRGRDGTLTGAAQFRPSRFGLGLSLGPTGPGLVWTPYAGTLTHPFTIEMVLTPDSVAGYNKLFSHDDSLDAGWYVHDGAFSAYPAGNEIANVFQAGQVAYVALASTSPTQLDVYLNGVRVGTTSMVFTAPPPQAVFFRDDRGGSEQLSGMVDAMRISTGTRTPAEMAAVLARIGD
jgi:hypothetical protein